MFTVGPATVMGIVLALVDAAAVKGVTIGNVLTVGAAILLVPGSGNLRCSGWRYI